MMVLLQNELVSKVAVKDKTQIKKVDDLYKQCFQNHFEKLYSYAFTIVKDDSEAKDIVQVAFIKLWQKRSTVHMPTAARAYLYTSVHNLSLNVIRNRKTRESHHQHLMSQDFRSTADELENKQTRERINKAIDDLPERCKEVFYKSRFEGRRYAEIASALNISIKTVEVHMGKALKLLRIQLADLITVMLYFFLHK